MSRKSTLKLQSCPTLCDPVDCSPPGSPVYGDSLGTNTGVGCYALLQGIFPTQRLSPSLSHCWQTLCCLSHQESPRILEWVAYTLLQRIFLTQESNRGVLHCRRILNDLATRKKLSKFDKHIKKNR